MNQGQFEALLGEAKRTNALLERLLEHLAPAKPAPKSATPRRDVAKAQTAAKAKRTKAKAKPGDGVKVA